MTYFRFHQNNSGGSFVVDDTAGIGPNVWIEAIDANDANRRARDIGLYWNGVDAGMDCECCGDRWYEQWSDDSGTPEPEIDGDYDFNWHDTVYVHALDGSIRRIKEAP